jgi:hypothetical protein
METNALALGGIAVMAVSLLLIPLGLPGLWIMMLVLAAGAWYGVVSWWLFTALLALSAVAEFLEWMAVDRLGRKYGGTRRTFWGALVGGVAGAIVGTPVPVIGASIATWTLVKDSEVAFNAGWGALLGRAVAIGLKTATGLVVLVVGGAALLF